MEEQVHTFPIPIPIINFNTKLYKDLRRGAPISQGNDHGPFPGEILLSAHAHLSLAILGVGQRVGVGGGGALSGAGEIEVPHQSISVGQSNLLASRCYFTPDHALVAHMSLLQLLSAPS